MASNRRSCLFHAESSLSFCLNHGIYCCAQCHATLNVSCVIKSVGDAVEHFHFEAETFRAMLEGSKQRCADMKMQFTELQKVNRKKHGEAADNVRELCDQLRNIADRFEAGAVLDVNQASTGRANSLERHLESVDIIFEFSGTLQRLLDIDGGRNRDQYQESKHRDNDLNKIRSQLEEFRDGFSSVSERLTNIESLSFDEFHAPLYIDKSRDDNLRDGLSKLYLDSTKKHNAGQSEHAQTDMLSGSQCKLWSDPTEPIKQLPRSDTPKQLAVSEMCTTDHRGCPTGDIVSQSLFTKFGELSFTGRRPAVCFVPSTAGHILLSTNEPNVLIKFDENGIEMVRRELPTSINDLCVRGKQIYATDSDCSVIVIDVDTLLGVETFGGLGVCRGINSFGEDFVITCATGDHKGVYLIGINAGALNVRRKSPYIFQHPNFVTSSASLEKIVVSGDDTVVIFSSELYPIRTLNTSINMVDPTGLCFTEESLIIACHKYKFVVEYSIDGKYLKTMFSSNDEVGSPRAISYYNETRTLAVSSTLNPKSVFIFKKKVCEESRAIASGGISRTCSHISWSQQNNQT